MGMRAAEVAVVCTGCNADRPHSSAAFVMCDTIDFSTANIDPAVGVDATLSVVDGRACEPSTVTRRPSQLERAVLLHGHCRRGRESRPRTRRAVGAARCRAPDVGPPLGHRCLANGTVEQIGQSPAQLPARPHRLPPSMPLRRTTGRSCCRVHGVYVHGVRLLETEKNLFSRTLTP